VFFAETVEDMELVREIRRHTRHPTRVELVDRATLRAFSQVARVRDSIRHATFPTAHPNTTVAEYSCVQHAKYELVAHAMTAGWIETTRCCWMDCGKIFDVLALSDCRRYQLQHRPEFDDGIHYTRSRPFSPKSLDAIQSGNDGAGEYCHAGGFFYGRTDAMAAWCATYLEQALRYQAAGWVFTDQATLYAMLSEGLAAGVLAHPFADCWCGLCRYLLRAVRSGSDSPPPSSSPVGSAACGDPRERGGSPGMLSGGVDPTAGDRETAHRPGEGGCSPGPTILMGVCNGERYLGEAIASVLRQSYPGFRLIIGLNGCTDRSGDIARSFSDPRVTVIELPEKGRVATLNALLAMVDTEFIAIQDDDDVWLPDKLETQMRFTGKCDVLGTFVEYIDASGNCSGVRPLSCRTDAEIKAAMAEGNNQMVNSSMVLNTSQVRAENGWNVDFEGVEDFDLSIRLARRGCRFFNVPEVLVYHRIHAASNFNAPGNHGQLIGLMKRHGIGS
jgi:hypothetical protein